MFLHSPLAINELIDEDAGLGIILLSPTRALEGKINKILRFA